MNSIACLMQAALKVCDVKAAIHGLLVEVQTWMNDHIRGTQMNMRHVNGVKPDIGTLICQQLPWPLSNYQEWNSHHWVGLVQRAAIMFKYKAVKSTSLKVNFFQEIFYENCYNNCVVVIEPMSPQTFCSYLESAVSGYATDNVESGRWPREGALARSQRDFDRSLPRGLRTPNNYLFEIKAAERGETVGFLWFAVEEKNSLRSAFVYDVEIKSEFRRQGYASQAFEILESFVRDLGLSRIGLHVFKQNEAALALYHKLGYEISSINMLKKLEVDIGEEE